MSEYKKLMLRLVDGQLVIDMDKHDAMEFKADGYTGLPEKFDLDVLCLAPVIGTVELSKEQLNLIDAAYKNGGKCNWCDNVVSELSHPHFYDFAVGKKMCRHCWDHDREVYKGSYGEDIGEFVAIAVGEAVEQLTG